jgi:small subunit ribosomal protein S6
MREYETIFVLEPNFDEAAVENEIEKLRDIIQNDGGEVLAVEKWGRRKLAYEIRKKKEGIYTLIRFKAKTSVLPLINRRYHLHEQLLRHLTVLYEAPPVGAAPVMGMAGHGVAAAPVTPVADTGAPAEA